MAPGYLCLCQSLVSCGWACWVFGSGMRVFILAAGDFFLVRCGCVRVCSSSWSSSLSFTPPHPISGTTGFRKPCASARKCGFWNRAWVILGPTCWCVTCIGMCCAWWVKVCQVSRCFWSYQALVLVYAARCCNMLIPFSKINKKQTPAVKPLKDQNHANGRYLPTFVLCVLAQAFLPTDPLPRMMVLLIHLEPFGALFTTKHWPFVEPPCCDNFASRNVGCSFPKKCNPGMLGTFRNTEPKWFLSLSFLFARFMLHSSL